MNALVLCVGQLSAGDGVPNDNVVARLNAADLLDWDGIQVHARTAIADDDVLPNRCSLFNMLLDHVNGDWQTVLAVRRLELEMAVSARQSFDVCSRL